MKKLNIFVLAMVLVFLVSTFYGCSNSQSVEDLAITLTADEIATEESCDDLKLEIIAVPQDEYTSESFTEDSSESPESDSKNTTPTETNPAETVATEQPSTEEQKIELPFIHVD